ncbi:hypothetical protein Aca07nite_82910 [Actinoplanes capillaceus]|uniref:Uncharacterized protein n=1 Tax=Actinoplanes campanulatus TaxID=113559 RepID=A0ABQ3WXJ6_9ACTN|nr:hypothetical protein Aca07nite_82910 [Actinoplanes capillaceus]
MALRPRRIRDTNSLPHRTRDLAHHTRVFRLGHANASTRSFLFPTALRAGRGEVGHAIYARRGPRGRAWQAGRGRTNGGA